MKKTGLLFALLIFQWCFHGYGAEFSINGTGASFPAPVYQVWIYEYSQTHPSCQVNYQSIGSGAGLNQLKSGTVDFAGSDNPLMDSELKENNLAQFPMLIGGVVVVYNLPGIKSGELKLDAETLSGIFLGKIRKWNDPAIVALNPQLKLPKLPVNVIHRADSSGTTFIFTNYLSKISQEWQKSVGCGPAVKWPVGIGGQKNPGVCNNVAKSIGTIGYTEYTYAVETKLAMATLKNRDGFFVTPAPEHFSAAAAGADWQNAVDFYQILTDQSGEKSWPITGLTYILVARVQADKAQWEAMKNYFSWCLTEGGKTAEALHYVPLPEFLVKKIETFWMENITIR